MEIVTGSGTPWLAGYSPASESRQVASAAASLLIYVKIAPREADVRLGAQPKGLLSTKWLSRGDWSWRVIWGRG